MQETSAKEQAQAKAWSPLKHTSEAEGNAKKGASWFYWIGGLSLINSAAVMLGSQFVLIVGLALTQFVDGISLGISDEMGGNAVILAVGFATNCCIAAGFFFLGWRARKLETWAFKLGMGVYALDAGLFLLFADWVSVGFHAFVLYWLFKGMKDANLALKQRAERLEMRPPKDPKAAAAEAGARVVAPNAAARVVMPTDPMSADTQVFAAGELGSDAEAAPEPGVVTFDDEPTIVEMPGTQSERPAAGIDDATLEPGVVLDDEPSDRKAA